MAYKASIERCTSGKIRLIVFTCIEDRNEPALGAGEADSVVVSVTMLLRGRDYRIRPD